MSPILNYAVEITRLADAMNCQNILPDSRLNQPKYIGNASREVWEHCRVQVRIREWLPFDLPFVHADQPHDQGVINVAFYELLAL